MEWRIYFFETKRGEKLVKEFIKGLDEDTISKVAHKIDLLKTYGPMLGMPHSKKLTTDLYELRIRGKEEIRIIYVFIKREIFFLHVFKKKTQETPTKEIKTATERLRALT